MKFQFLITFLTIITLGLALDKKRADKDTTTSETTTSVYVTITTDGHTTVVQTPFSQSFMSTYTSATGAAKSGEIGMGSLSGSLGHVRSYEKTTVHNSAVALFTPENTYAGIFGLFVLVVGGLL